MLAAIAATSSVAIFVKDRDGRYQLVNRYLADLWDAPVEEILGKTDFELLPEGMARQLRINDRRVMDSGGPMTLEERVEFDGEPLVYLSSKVPLVADDGEVYGICGIAADITDRKAAEATLRENEERFRTMADAAPVMIWLSNRNKEGAFFNRTWLEFTGRSMDEELGGGWLEGVHPDDQPALAACQAAFEERRPFSTEFRMRRHDGEYRWLLDTGVPRHEPDGSFAGFIGSCVDISEKMHLQQTLRAQAEELAQQGERKDEFLAMLGHELRNPMAPMRNVIDLFQARKGSLDEELRGALGVADRQLTHMKRLVDDLLDLARINRGRVEVDREPLRLGQVVRNAVEAQHALFERRDIHLEVDLGEEEVPVVGDETRLAQVVGNLLHNAAKYTPEGGRVALRLTAEGEGAGEGVGVIEVTDDGIGIEPHRLERIFEQFSQREQSLERSEGGLGIGLSLVRRLVELHGGSVAALSEGLGHGSTFRVELPTHHGEPAPEAQQPPGKDLASQPCRVLVVDDNTDSADSLATLLQLDGHATACAYDGEEALAEVASFAPDVVLLDIGLPRLDGYEVGRRIRASAGRQPTLIALTGYGQQTALDTTREIGFDHHLLKPVDLPQLRDILGSVAACTSS